jgi:hypothetical protein
LNTKELKLKWNSIRPKNILKWKPVKDLLLIDIKLLLRQEDPELQALREYVRHLKKYYNAFRNNTSLGKIAAVN